MAFDPVAARARLKRKIAEQDATRGRPLTDAEKLANLRNALEMVRDADDDCHRDGLQTIPSMARAKIDEVLSQSEPSPDQ